MIVCIFVIAGRPPPRVVWYRNGKLIDTSDYYEDGVMKNDLTISILARSDLGAELTCETSNNNISRPLATTVQLDMNCKYFTNIKSKTIRINMYSILFARNFDKKVQGYNES